jgi:hypothetical protein
MVIGSNVAQAAITQVDACTGCKFTAATVFLIYKSKGADKAAPLAA